MDYRHATPEDVADIQRVAERSWEHDYPAFLNRESVREVVHEWYSTDQLEHDVEAADVRLIVACEDDDVVGFAHGIVSDETGTILRVYVDPDQRGNGAGRALVEYTMDDFSRSGVERVEAMVLAENEPGNEFYSALGFELVQRAMTTIGDESHAEHIYLKLV